MQNIACFITLLLTLLSTAMPLPAGAFSLIRDAEIEHTLRRYANPIFAAADITPDSVKIFIINDADINAFVAGGQNIFINTGLLLATDTPHMLIGVIAHETGHIAGGHLVQGTEKLRNAQLGTVLSYILGAATGIVTGRGDAGAAIMSAGQNTAIRNLLANSRANEQAADQAALSYLDKLHISAHGMLHLFEILRNQENLQFGTGSPYLRTHPLSKERIIHIRGHVAGSPLSENAIQAGYTEIHRRMIAKLFGFLKTPKETLAKYPLRDKSVEARYARAVAYYKIPDVQKSLAELDSLIAFSPRDPFFHELKGQVLFENGKAIEALRAYQKAVELQVDSPLILTDLAKVELAVGRQDLIESAIAHLERASNLDNTNTFTWRLLATAYGKKNELGRSYLALAEEAALQNNPDVMAARSDLALQHLKTGSPSRLRAQDLKLLAEKIKKDQEKED